MAPRPGKRQKLEDESIDSDELSSTNFSENEAEEEEKVVMSAEAKRLLMAQEYMEKMGVKYDGSNDLENVSRALGIFGDAGTKDIRTIAIADEIQFSVLQTLPAKNHRATCVEISFDDKFAYTGGKDGRIAIWDLTEMKRAGNLGHPASKTEAEMRPTKAGTRPAGMTASSTPPASAVTSICLAMGGKILVSASTDRCLRIWDLSTRELLHTFKEVKGIINSVTAIGDSLFSVAEDKALRQYSLLSKTCTKAFYGHGARITQIDCLGQDHVLTVGDDKTARFWNLKFDKHSQYNGSADIDSCCILNKHGFVSGDNKGRICLWSIARKKALKTESALNSDDPVAPCSALALVPNTDACFSGTETGLVQCWKASMAEGGVLEKRGEVIRTPGIINGMKVSRSGKFLLIATATESRLGRWNTNKVKEAGLIVVELKHNKISKLFSDGDLIK